ncbi:LLM class flavin-dependent oxidoreductase [Thauera linaloolentis]|uniref:NtaA/SnaA/SoxA family monooxygenase n=1 Tax=Thauera linaloolentis (strain DSM 12138 / JCM 21573 / CCUG 41526 / CIP 105981 / IAM 15112 / NBRC 102519 / 47Lol) TaxID=1123367 RepID=N6Y5I1_THAL4|nr:LLM class flavin-dependent oxidoreductase [Thauera linaloolentis]ENO89441.1 NtaA/SnaA/SoxA family monooxygenase [Thauera linaloolentis 47Lol = DSM 12138]MCM8566922.1 LLM class flavin-dependent oxidoreductase [Thauera linaloolentis]
MSTPKQIKLGFVLFGAGPGYDDWRHPDAVVDASTNIEHYRRQARVAEAGKFDFLFVADSVFITERSSPHYLNRFEPLTILSALAGATSRIGLVGTLTSSYTEPYNVARQFASLDLISGGRAGWNVVTSWLSGTAANFGKAEHPQHETRYRLAAEHLHVVQGLWDSYEDDAFPRDKQRGVFLDPGKQHQLNHKGEFFSVRGPLNISRSPQGQPVIFQAGASEEGRNFAARHAEALFVEAGTLEATIAYAEDIRRRATAFGRAPDSYGLFPGLRTVVAPTEEEARRKYKEAQSLVRIEEALKQLGVPFDGYDFSQHPLDEAFPELPASAYASNRSVSERIAGFARDNKLTLRETALRSASPREEFVGSPVQVADAIQRWFESGAIAGFNYVESLPRQLDAFVELVIPILQERGLYKRDYTATTLRGHLDFAVPENRYTLARRTGAAA